MLVASKGLRAVAIIASNGVSILRQGNGHPAGFPESQTPAPFFLMTRVKAGAGNGLGIS